MAARSGSKKPAPYRIAHFSDLHLTARDDAKRSELFPTLQGMNESFRTIIHSPVLDRYDTLLFTGDITDRGDVASWRVFWREIDQAGLRKKTLVVPGNHDVCSLSPLPRLSAKGYRKSDLQKAQTGLRLGGQSDTFPWARVVDPRVAVFGMNSNNLGNWHAATNALGEIGYNQLAKLARLLRKHQDVPVKIVALHHSPNIPLKERSTSHGASHTSAALAKLHQIPQEQRRMLRLICIAQGVRLVVHGHMHRPYDHRVDSVQIVGVPASTQPTKMPKGGRGLPFASYTVRGAGGRVDRRWEFIKV